MTRDIEEKFENWLQDKVAAGPVGIHVTADPGSNPEDIMEEIMRLDHLADEGMLTKTEFEEEFGSLDAVDFPKLLASLNESKK